MPADHDHTPQVGGDFSVLDDDKPAAAPIRRRRARRLKIVVAAVVLAAVIGGLLFEFASPAPKPTAGPPPAVPVETAVARRADVPVEASGLGNVQAFNTVTVRVRVDGELQKVLFNEGQDVKAGDLLAEIDPRPLQATLDQAIGKKAADEAQLANAKRDLARFEPLAARQDITRQQLDTQRALVAQLESSVKGDDAAIEGARIQLQYAKIYAPISGRAGIRLVDAGNMVHPTDTNGLVVITQVQPISVTFTLPEDTLPALNRGQAKGPLAVTALARNQKDVLGEGTLAVVDNQIDQATGTIRLKATFPNPEKTLWPGQFVVARVRLDIRKGVVTVPSTAVQRGAKGLYVYVVNPDSTVELRWVKIAEIGIGESVIDDGVREGERVVTAGHYRLQSGVKVTWHS